jgi:hypothetical protein
MDIVRLKRSPDYSPFGRADGEGSQPRRRARNSEHIKEESTIFPIVKSDAQKVQGLIESVRIERSRVYSPFARADGEESQPRRKL